MNIELLSVKSWWVWFAFGTCLMVLLHVQYSLLWNWYLLSVPGYPKAFSLGVPPQAGMTSTSVARYVGIASCFLIGLSARMMSTQKTLQLISSVATGALATQILIDVFITGSLLSNLWPFGLAWLLVMIPLPIVGGVVAASGLKRAWDSFCSR